MMSLIYKFIRRILFLFDPEKMHELATWWIKLSGAVNIKCTGQRSPLGFTIFGQNLPNPLAMAAGFDKNGDLVNGLCAYGFGYVESGTFTKKAQAGNDKPRVFRIPENQALFNRMGFNNPGIYEGLKSLSSVRFPFAISIGKSKETSLADAAGDYIEILKEIEKSGNAELKDLILYIAINVSSPNTPDLRKLQNAKFITELIKQCRKTSKIPVVIKFAPDFTKPAEFETLLKAAIKAGVDGVIVTNTTADENITKCVPEDIRKKGGGLSGLPLRDKSLKYLKLTEEICRGKIPIISSGGVMTPDDVWQRFQMGASIVQIYTGFIYNGPGFIAQCLDYLEMKLTENGYDGFEDYLQKRGKPQAVQTKTRKLKEKKSKT